MFTKLSLYIVKLGRWLKTFWRKNWWHKTLIIVILVLLTLVGGAYGIARWYIASEKGQQVLGVSFIPAYAESLGLDAQKTMDGLINDVGVRHFRLVSYWDQLEPSKGNYDFSLLDWQFRKAEAAHAKITLAIGLRQPRWPECHAPDWTKSEPKSQWQPQLNDFMTQVINRYKSSPSLDSYQLENEFSLDGFGTCTDFDRSRLIQEFALVKKLDAAHPVIMSRSVNFPTPMLSAPRPDIVGFSIYRRVWDGQFTHRYFTYPMPSWYFAFQAGVQKILTGRESIVHEIQAEAWPPNGQSIQQTSLAEQDKTISADRLKSTVQFGKNTGMRQIYLWGAEYWYYRAQTLHDPSLLQTATQEFHQNQN